MARSWLFIVVALAAAICPAVAEDRVTLTYSFTNRGMPLEDPESARFYVYDVEAPDVYVAWGTGLRPSVTLEKGTYRIVVKYVNDKVQFQEEFEEIELTEDVFVEYDFDLPVAHLTLWITSGGFPIPSHAGRYSIYRRGQRGKPLASRRPGESLTISPGTYDIEVVYRGPDGLKSQWIEGYSLEGLRQESIEIGSSNIRMTLTLTDDGRPLDSDRAVWRVYPPGTRDIPLAEAHSGETIMLSPGTYDVGLFYQSGADRRERWVVGLEATGHVDRQIDLSDTADRVTVDIRHDGRTLSDAWFALYPVGDRSRKLYEANSGQTLEIEPGTYDVGCFVRRGGVRAVKWLEAQELSGPNELQVEMDYREASLRVQPTSRGRGDRGPSNLLIVVDSSAAMMLEMDGRSRMEQLQKTLVDGIDVLLGTDTRVGLRVFGITPPRGQSDCTDSTLLVPVSGLDRRLLDRSIELLRPTGRSPIAYSLEQAARDLPAEGSRSLLLITGSTDSCEGDVCAAAARLLREGEVSRIYVIALAADREMRRRLDCVGEVRTARTELELEAALREILREVRRGEEGSVLVFDPTGENLVVSGGLRERIRMTAGTYDVLVRNGDKVYTWKDVDVRGDVEARAGSKPPRSRQ